LIDEFIAAWTIRKWGFTGGSKSLGAGLQRAYLALLVALPLLCHQESSFAFSCPLHHDVGLATGLQAIGSIDHRLKSLKL
jgi:hypothetical protein